jgi:hypothetical protein
MILEISPWLGAIALLMIVASGVVWFRAALAVRLPKNRMPYLAFWLVAGVISLVSLTNSPGWLGAIPASLALVGSLFFLFTAAISRQVLAANAIAPGQTIPEFSAPDENNEWFKSASLSGGPVLLKFFRGHW